MSTRHLDRSPGGRGSRRLAWLVGGAVLALACTATTPLPRPAPEGRFVGTTDDAREIRLELRPTAGGLVGVGELDGRPLRVSVLTGTRGAGAAALGELLVPVTAELSFDGEHLELALAGTTARLRREGPQVATPGSRGGRYVDRTGGGAELTLTADRSLVAGTGLFLGRHFALAGTMDGTGRIRGRVFHADGTEAAVSGALSDDGRQLRLVGLGAALELVRRRDDAP